MDWLGTKQERKRQPVAVPQRAETGAAATRAAAQPFGMRSLDTGVTLEVWQRYVESERSRNRRVVVWTSTIFLFIVLLLLTLFVVVGLFVVSNSNRAADIADDVQTQAAQYGAQVVGMAGRMDNIEDRQREVSGILEEREDLRARERQILKFDLDRFGKWVEANQARSVQAVAEVEKRLRDMESAAAARAKDLEAVQEKYKALQAQLIDHPGAGGMGAAPAPRDMLVAALTPGPVRAGPQPAPVAPSAPPAPAAEPAAPAAMDAPPDPAAPAVDTGELSAAIEEPRPPDGQPREISVVTFPGGDRYEGEFRGGLFDGWGVYYYRNGDRYEGEFRQDMKNGRGTLVCKSGERYVGEYRDDARQGSGSLVLANGDRYVGQFRSDMMSGRGTLVYRNGNKYSGDFSNGLKHGNGVYTFANGDVYKGEFRQDLREGRGTYQFIDGSSYIGEFKAGKRHGKGRYVFAGGGEYVGEFKGGRKNGVGVCIYPNGKRINGLWQNDRLVQALPE